MDEEIKEYKDKTSYDEESILNTEVKINPDYYIHRAIVKAQDALEREDIKAGYIKFRVFIEMAEQISIAAGILGDDYKISIKEYKENDPDYINANEEFTKSSKLANYKLRLLLKAVFDNKILSSPIKM